LPSIKISDDLKDIIASLIENMNPSFGSIAKLTPDEKDLYNKVIKETSIDQRLLIPSPKLDEDQQQYHRFQILCGELEAGNNNSDMIKELKQLLVKLMHKGLIPKAQSREVLHDLLLLGF
jgi:hypothetical protein